MLKFFICKKNFLTKGHVDGEMNALYPCAGHKIEHISL